MPLLLAGNLILANALGLTENLTGPTLPTGVVSNQTFRKDMAAKLGKMGRFTLVISSLELATGTVKKLDLMANHLKAPGQTTNKSRAPLPTVRMKRTREIS